MILEVQRPHKENWCAENRYPLVSFSMIESSHSRLFSKKVIIEKHGQVAVAHFNRQKEPTPILWIPRRNGKLVLPDVSLQDLIDISVLVEEYIAANMGDYNDYFDEAATEKELEEARPYLMVWRMLLSETALPLKSYSHLMNKFCL